MKNTLLRSIKLLMIVAAISFSCFACDKVENIDDNPNIDVPVTENNDTVDNTTDENITEDQFTDETEEVTDEIDDEEKQFESLLLSSSPYLSLDLALVENKIIVLMGHPSLQEKYKIYDNQVIAIKCDRFIFLKDGSIVDLLKERKQKSHEEGIKESFEPEDWDKHLKTEMTEEILNDYHKSIGIKDIRVDYYRGLYYVLLANGEVHTLSTEFNTKVNTSNSEDTNSYDNQKNIVLRPDGTLNCPQFPETEDWTDIVDYRIASNFILALTSDGKLLSSGIEFEHENIGKFDIWDICQGDSNQGDLPIALTANGQLIFGELTSRDQISQYSLEKIDKNIETAKTFTDVKDFTSYGYIVIVQKKDESIWATQYIDVFSEYVNFPNEMNISSGEEEIEAELFCANCNTLIPQGMSECPECGAS